MRVHELLSVLNRANVESLQINGVNTTYTELQARHANCIVNRIHITTSIVDLTKDSIRSTLIADNEYDIMSNVYIEYVLPNQSSYIQISINIETKGE